jgi:hypothetical protein
VSKWKATVLIALPSGRKLPLEKQFDGDVEARAWCEAIMSDKRARAMSAEVNLAEPSKDSWTSWRLKQGTVSRGQEDGPRFSWEEIDHEGV